MKRDKFIWDETKEVDIDNENSENEDYGDFSQFNQIQEEQETIEKTSKRYKVRDKKSRNIVVISIVTIIALLIFLPINRIDKININEISFVTRKEIIDQIEVSEGKYYSIFQLIFIEKKIEDEFIYESVSEFSLKDHSITLKVKEYKPIAIDDEGTFYYSNDSEVLSTQDTSYRAPILIGFDETSTNLIVEQLSSLEYNVLKEIAGIQPNFNEINNQLILISMEDGNYIEININQINTKLPYYLQMQAIINSEKGGKNGIIHLNIGDYYEPF